jgi:hypothetical protein
MYQLFETARGLSLFRPKKSESAISAYHNQKTSQKLIVKNWRLFTQLQGSNEFDESRSELVACEAHRPPIIPSGGLVADALINRHALFEEQMMSDEHSRVRRTCFACNKELFSSFEKGESPMEFSDPPDNAVCWHTSGNWGSRTMDSSPYEPHYEISICDDCIIERGDRIIVYERMAPSQHHTSVLGTFHKHEETSLTRAMRDLCAEKKTSQQR